jgi:hypothetical protein
MSQTNLILPEPSQFLSANLPPVSIIQPTLDQNGGAMAAIQGFISHNLFMGQSNAFLELLLELAAQPDAVERHNRR